MNLKKALILIFVLTFLSNSINCYAISEQSSPKSASEFADIPGNHWGVEAINWGLTQNIIAGYGNGIFKPDSSLTEAEFATMFARFASNTNKDEIKTPVIGAHWGQSYYNGLDDFEIPFRGYMNDMIKDAEISRGQIAVIVAAKYGFNLTEKQAIYFMYENDLSKGTDASLRTYESYGADKSLTRTEAVQFMKNIENQGTKEMTFKGQKSIKGVQKDGREILGVVGVPVDPSITVDFADFGMMGTPVVGSGITTKVVGDKVVVEMEKITKPIKIEGARGQFINYFDFDANGFINASPMNNSIIKYKGVELPLGDGFMLNESMMINVGEDKSTGLVAVEFDGNGIATTGSFVDKESFKSLLNNLKHFKASSSQITKAQSMIDTWAGKHNERNSLSYFTIRSTSKDSAMLILVGNGNVNIGMYDDAESVYLGTIEVVD